MYVVRYKGLVVLGLIPWNNQYIINVMKVRYREDIVIPFLEPASDAFPLIVNDDIIIYQGEENRPTGCNTLIEQYHGPFWEFVDNKVIANYNIVPLSLTDAKINYKNLAANLRYQQEIKGIIVNINSKDFKIETDRETRKKYFEKLSIIDSDTINWKFIEGWASLNKFDIQTICNAIDKHVQSTFENEFNLHNLIDQASTVEDLLSIEQLNIKNSLL